MKSDQELQKTFQIALDDKGVIVLNFLTVLNNTQEYDRRTALISKQIYKIYSQNPDKKFNILVDTSQLGEEPAIMPKESRQLYRGIVENAQTNKAAVLGNSEQQRKVIVTFVLWMAQMAGLRNIKWFNDRAEAYGWLES